MRGTRTTTITSADGTERQIEYWLEIEEGKTTIHWLGDVTLKNGDSLTMPLGTFTAGT